MDKNIKNTIDVNFPSTQNVSGAVNVDNFPATQTVTGSVNVGNLPATQTVEGNVVVRDKIRDYRKNDQCWVHNVSGFIDAEAGGYDYQFISLYNFSSEGKYTYIYDLSSVVSHPINNASGGGITVFVNKITMNLDGNGDIVTPSGGSTKSALSMSMLNGTQSHTECRVGIPSTTNFITADNSESMFRRRIKLNSSTDSGNTETIITEHFHSEFLELPPNTGIAISLQTNDGDVDTNYSANIKFFESDYRV